MITTTKLIEQLSKFPQGARVKLVGDFAIIFGPGGVEPGYIHCPPKGRPQRLKMGGWRGWMDSVFHTAGGRIQRFLLEKPAEARAIAFAAIAGLYLGEDEDAALPEDSCYPRGAGSDYVDEVGRALECSGIMHLIGTLNGVEFKHEGVVYAEHAWDAGELAEAEVRTQFPGVILKDDEPERGVTSSPQVFVTRDIVNRAVSRGKRDPNTGALLREEIPDEFVAGEHKPPTIEHFPPLPPP